MSDQMTALKAQYGVTTYRALNRAVRADMLANTGDAMSVRVADVVIDQMLDAMYQRIAGGEFDAPLDVATAPDPVPDPDVDYREDYFGYDDDRP